MKFEKKKFVPIIVALITYLLSYTLPKVLVPAERLHFVIVELDELVPLHSPAIFIYYLAFFQWMFAAFILYQNDKKLIYKYASAVMIGSVIGFVVFMAYPTAVNRPEIMGTGISDKLIILTYSVDNITCAMPSFHCFLSTMVIFILKDCRSSRKTLYINCIISVLVFISTLMTKQHYFVDVPTGILLAFIGVYLSNIFSFDALFERISNR